jgi:hypothetical protein
MAEIFDPSTVDENAAEPVYFVEPGTYKILIEHAELKPNSKGTGRGIQINHSVYDNRSARFRNWFNYEHEDTQVQNRGRGELKRFLAALGVKRAVDLDNLDGVLKGKTVTADLEVEEWQGRKQNKVKAYIAPPAATDSVPF